MQRIVVAEWGRAERRAVRDALLASRQGEDTAIRELTRLLATDFGQRSIFLFSRGRAVIEVALRCFMDLRPGRTEVIFPGYICPSVIEGIERSGLTPIAADVGVDLNLDPADVGQRLSPRTLAVVAAHMYACPARMPELEAICARQGAFLIDDAAQVAGVALDGRPLGSFGTCGVLSFSQSKTLVTGIGDAGGALIVNDTAVEAGAQRAWAAADPGRYGWKNLLMFLAEAVYHEQTKYIRYYARMAHDRVHLGLRPASATGTRMANGSALVAIAQRESLADRIQGRRRVADAFARHLAHSSVSFPQYEPGRYLSRIIVSLPARTSVDAVRRRLRIRGVQTRKPYPINPRYSAGLVRALAVQPQLLELPSHSRMHDRDVAQICSIIVDEAQRAMKVDGEEAGRMPERHD